MMPPLMWSCTATVSIWCVCVSALDRPTCSCCCRNKWRNWNLIWFCSLNREMKEVDNFGCFLLQMTDLSLGQSFWNISSHYSIDLEGHMVPVNFTERACWAARKRVERASAVEVKKKENGWLICQGKTKECRVPKTTTKVKFALLTTEMPSMETSIDKSIMSRANRAMQRACSLHGSGKPLTAIYLSPTVSTCHKTHKR